MAPERVLRTEPDTLPLHTNQAVSEQYNAALKAEEILAESRSYSQTKLPEVRLNRLLANRAESAETLVWAQKVINELEALGPNATPEQVAELAEFKAIKERNLGALKDFDRAIKKNSKAGPLFIDMVAKAEGNSLLDSLKVKDQLDKWDTRPSMIKEDIEPEILKDMLGKIKGRAMDGLAFFAHMVPEEMMGGLKAVKIKLKDRGEWDEKTKTVYLEPGGYRTEQLMAHEMTHALEDASPEVLANSKKFLLKRAKERKAVVGTHRGMTKDEETLIGEDKKPILGKGQEEAGTNAYAGKLYITRWLKDGLTAEELEHPAYSDAIYATEVMTIGIEKLMTDHVKFAKEDPEWFRFVIANFRGKYVDNETLAAAEAAKASAAATAPKHGPRMIKIRWGEG